MSTDNEAPGFGYAPEFLRAMSAKSAELQAVGDAAGLPRGKFIALVERLAKAQGLRAWCDTQTVADYDALIAAARAEVERDAA